MFHGTWIYHVGQSFCGLSNFCELAKFSNVQYISFICHFLIIVFVRYVSTRVVSVLKFIIHVFTSCSGVFVVCSKNIHNTFHFDRGNLFVRLTAAFACDRKLYATFQFSKNHII